MWQSSWIHFWKLSHTWKLVLFHVKISLFLLFWNLATFIESHCIFLLRGSLPLCWFMDPVNGYSKSKLLVKFSLKSEIRIGYLSFVIFVAQFSTLINFQPTCWCSVKATCWAYPWLIFFRVKWWQNVGKTMSIN